MVPVKALVSIPAVSWTATGVPLFDYFMALSVQEAATKACTLLAISAVGVLLGQKILDYIEDKVRQQLGDQVAVALGWGETGWAVHAWGLHCRPCLVPALSGHTGGSHTCSSGHLHALACYASPLPPSQPVTNTVEAVRARKLQLVDAAERITTATGLDLLVTTGLVASHRPARVVLPLYGLSYGTLVGRALSRSQWWQWAGSA